MSAPPSRPPFDVARLGLLVVDMQNEFVRRDREPAASERLEEVVDVIARLADACRAAARPVIYTRVCFRPGYPDAHRDSAARRTGALVEDEVNSAVIDELLPGEADFVVTKRRTGAFYQTDLELLLSGLGVEQIVVTGLSTPRAVESTVREAHSRDLECFVVRDGTYVEDLAFHEASLSALDRWFAQVLVSQEVLGVLGGTS